MRPLIGRRRLGPIPVTPKCWKEGAGVAQCKVHPESPLSGHPAADTSDPVRFGGLPVPRPLESLGSWKPPARRAADPWSEPLDRDCPPPPQPEPALPPCTPSRRLLRGQDRHLQPDRLSGCSLGWGREAPRRIRNTVSGPAWGVSSMEKLVKVEEAGRRERSCS